MEILANIFTALSIFSTSIGRKICWIFSIIAASLFMVIFNHNGSYLNVLLQIAFILQSIWGWFYWDFSKFKPTRLSNRLNLLWAIPLVIILYMLSVYMGSSGPLLDSISTGFSLFAVTLTIFQKVESWIFWILVDISLTVLFLISGLYASAVFYLIFMIISIHGLYKWNLYV